MVELFLVAHHVVVLVEDSRLEHGAVIVDSADGLAAHDLGTVELGQLDLVVNCRDVARAGIHGDLASARAQCGTGNIHSDVTGADNRHVLPDRHTCGVDQIVDTKQHVTARLAGNPQLAGTPSASAHKDRVITVAQQIVDMQRAADGGRGTHAHAERAHHMAILLHERTRQTELRNAVLQHAADLGALLKHGDSAPQLGHLNGNGNAGGTGADHGDLLAARRCRLPLLAVQIRRRDIVLDARKMHRRTLATLNTRTLTLSGVVADHGADGAHRIVLEQQLARLLQTALLEQVDDLWNGRLHRAPLNLAECPFAAQTTIRFLDDVDSHAIPLLSNPNERRRKHLAAA